MQTLRKRPTYNEVIYYLENDQPIIKYPNRDATFIRNSPYLSQFDGDSWIDLEEQEQNINKEKLKEIEVNRIAGSTKSTAQLLRASNTQTNRKWNQITQTDAPSTSEKFTMTSTNKTTGAQTDNPSTSDKFTKTEKT